MVTIYDPENNPIQRQPLDAKECIESGYYTKEPSLEPKDESEQEPKSVVKRGRKPRAETE